MCTIRHLRHAEKPCLFGSNALCKTLTGFRRCKTLRFLSFLSATTTKPLQSKCECNLFIIKKFYFDYCCLQLNFVARTIINTPTNPNLFRLPNKRGKPLYYGCMDSSNHRQLLYFGHARYKYVVVLVCVCLRQFRLFRYEWQSMLLQNGLIRQTFAFGRLYH